jgi:hypothetical protein
LRYKEARSQLLRFFFAKGPGQRQPQDKTTTRQGKKRHAKTRQDKTRQGKARQDDNPRQGKTRQGKARQGKARQGKTRHKTQDKTATRFKNHKKKIDHHSPF